MISAVASRISACFSGSSTKRVKVTFSGKRRMMEAPPSEPMMMRSAVGSLAKARTKVGRFFRYS
jgi:hypothetical protein